MRVNWDFCQKVIGKWGVLNPIFLQEECSKQNPWGSRRPLLSDQWETERAGFLAAVLRISHLPGIWYKRWEGRRELESPFSTGAALSLEVCGLAAPPVLSPSDLPWKGSQPHLLFLSTWYVHGATIAGFWSLNKWKLIPGTILDTVMV